MPSCSPRRAERPGSRRSPRLLRILPGASSTRSSASSKDADIAPDAISYLVHGTTVATNSIIEGKTPRTAFITTEGFRDMLEIGRQVRPTLYDVHFEKPRPLVPRNLCFEVGERLDARGSVLEPLDEARVHEIARTLAEQDVVSVAVCLLHGYLNPVHEQRIGELLRTHDQELVISLSSDVCPEFREYFRASTTIINACVRPVLARYLADIESRLRGRGMTAELLIMQSSGGVLTFETGCGEAGLHGRIGSRRGGHRRQLHRRRAGPRRRDLLRHGRHHRQGGAHPRRPAQGHQGVRGGRPGQPGGRPGPRERLSHPDPGHRPGRDRRRRRAASRGSIRAASCG